MSTEYSDFPDQDIFGGEPTSPDQCEFERQTPTGTIQSCEQIPWSSDTIGRLRDGWWWWEPTEDDVYENETFEEVAAMAGAEQVMPDREGKVFEMVTSDGTFYVVSSNTEGHGDLAFYKLKNA